MKKILGLTVAALLVMAMVGGGTWAYFSDIETTSANITAGTLDLTVGGGNVHFEMPALIDKKPSDNGTFSVALNNKGSLAGKLTVAITVTDTAAQSVHDAPYLEYEDASANLGGVALMAVFIDIDQSGTWSSGDIGLNSTPGTYNHPTDLAYATFNSYTPKTWTDVYIMNPTVTDNFTILWGIPLGAAQEYNNIQGDRVTTNITLTLNQLQ